MVSRVQVPSSSSLPSLPSFSRWNHWTVGIVCVMTAAALYACWRLLHDLLQSSTPSAEGILRFKIQGLTFYEDLIVKCYAEKKIFFEQRAGDIASSKTRTFFLPKLPFQQLIHVSFGQDEKNLQTIDIKVDRPTGLYTITGNLNDKDFTTTSEELIALQVLPIQPVDKPFSLNRTDIFLILKDGKISYNSMPIESESGTLFIDNFDTSRIIGLHIGSLHPEIPEKNRDMVLYWTIDATQLRRISREILNQDWTHAYEQYTGHPPMVSKDLQLHL